MSSFGLDFGLLIAYFVPGLIAALGLSYYFPSIRSVLQTMTRDERSTGTFLFVATLALVLGMSVSIVRAITIDQTFNVELPFKLAPPIERQDPRFENLVSEGRLSAYLEAKAADKRPYQFYGNTCLSLLILGIGLFFRSGRSEWRPKASALIIIVLSVAILYPAARRSHYRYAITVKAFNALPPEAGS